MKRQLTKILTPVVIGITLFTSSLTGCYNPEPYFGEANTYIAKKGDNFWNIAKMYLEENQEYNSIDFQEMLLDIREKNGWNGPQKGQKIYLPEYK